MNHIIQTLAVYALPLLFALTMREAARVYVAWRLGDTSAKAAGMLSLNPAKFIDPLGTIVLPVITFAFSVAGAFPLVIGYPKRAPINFGQMRNPKMGIVWVSATGLGANLAMALAWLILSVLIAPQIAPTDVNFFFEMARAGYFVNLAIFALNLFPLPPMDGGAILMGLLPPAYGFKLAKVEPYSFFVLMLLMLTNILFRFWVIPLMTLADIALQLIVSPLKSLLS